LTLVFTEGLSAGLPGQVPSRDGKAGAQPLGEYERQRPFSEAIRHVEVNENSRLAKKLGHLKRRSIGHVAVMVICPAGKSPAEFLPPINASQVKGSPGILSREDE